jgi:hypothetical protein
MYLHRKFGMSKTPYVDTLISLKLWVFSATPLRVLGKDEDHLWRDMPCGAMP